MADNYYENIKASALDPRADVQAEATMVRAEVTEADKKTNPQWRDDMADLVF